jgi:Relaxase/Mobilisation nuclease domain
MIGNVTTGSDFRGICSYVLEKEGSDYLDSNMMGEDVEELASEFNALLKVGIGTDVKKRVWHISLSAAIGENISDDKWMILAHDYLRRMGLNISNHQYLVYKHTDKPYGHIHIVVNRVSFIGKVHPDNWLRLKSKEVCLELEKVHKLKQTLPKDRDRERGGLERDVRMM